MSKYIVLNQLIDREIINQIMKMDDSAEIVFDSSNFLVDHSHTETFGIICNYFIEFDIHDVFYDVIKYENIDDVILGTILSDCRYVILKISDDELYGLRFMCDYRRIKKFQDLIHTLDCCKDDTEQATDYFLDGALEKVISVIDDNLDDIRQQIEVMRNNMISNVENSWSLHFHKLSA